MSVLIPVKFSSLATQSTLNSFDFIVGTRNAGLGLFVNYKYPINAIADYIIGVFTQMITASTAKITTTTNTDDTLEDDWFLGKEIQEISTNNQIYLLGVDFNQIGNKIILTSGFWQDTQKLRAKI
jgi:hypothetical protein